MDKEYIDKKIQSDSLVRIANAIEEILRLVKKDMEPRTKEKESTWLLQNPWYKVSMSRSLKPEFQEGGSKRQVILDRSVEYILDPKFGFQGDKHAFLVDKVGLSQTEYLECLNRASNGGLVKSALWNS